MSIFTQPFDCVLRKEFGVKTRLVEKAFTSKCRQSFKRIAAKRSLRRYYPEEVEMYEEEEKEEFVIVAG